MLDISKIHFSRGNHLFAVSGGVDSMVLLHIALRKITKENIFVVHFHHGLRGENADFDHNFVRDFCQKNGITFFSEYKNIAELSELEKMSIEATGRKYRYQFFAKIYQEIGAIGLYTAHHNDDFIETAIFNLIRGAKFSGLNALKSEKNIQITNQSIALFRPLLSFSKKEILEFAHKNNIQFCTDETNSDISFHRNFIRNQILKDFEVINPNYRRAISNFCEYSAEISDYFSEKVQGWIENQNTKNEKYFQKYCPKNTQMLCIFGIGDFENISKVLQKSIFEYFYNTANDGNIGLSGGIFKEFFRFVFEAKNSHGQKEFHKLFFERRGDFVWCAIRKNPEKNKKILDFSEKSL